MKDYLFIFGKNPNLSLAEIVSYLEARKIKFTLKDYLGEVGIISTEHINASVMEDLGGTIKIAEVMVSAKTKDEAVKSLDKVDMGTLFVKKGLFGVSAYTNHEDHVLFSELFKAKAKEFGITTGYIHLPNDRSSLLHIEIIKKKLLENSFEIIVCSGKNYYVAKTLYVHNPYAFQKRDVGRPVQRAIFSIPPRLSRIMINLAGVTKGTLLDPFCGIGSILQEAALMGFVVRGIDIDPRCVSSCETNLEWLKKEYKITADTGVLKGDAKMLNHYLKKNSIDAVVAEPYLGPPLRRAPSYKKASLILNRIGLLYENSISSMINVLKPGRRLVLVVPCFNTDKGMVTLDARRMANRFGGAVIDPLKRYGVEHEYPFLDYEERHRTIRQIIVIEKK